MFVLQMGFLYLSINCLNSIHDPAPPSARLLRQAIDDNLYYTKRYLQLFYETNPDWPTDANPFLQSEAWQDWDFYQTLHSLLETEKE